MIIFVFAPQGVPAPGGDVMIAGGAAGDFDGGDIILTGGESNQATGGHIKLRSPCPSVSMTLT